MSDPSRDDSPREDPDERRSVLAELPHERPQRPSRRRADARARASAPRRPAKPERSATPKRSVTPKRSADRQRPAKTTASSRASAGTAARSTARKRPAKTASGTSAAPRRRSAPRAQQPATTARQEAPRQGYEIDAELANTPVAPPTGIELLGALAELAGELASSGVSAGGRLLKGAIGRISGS